MGFKSLLPKLRISTKMLLLNLMILTAFILIAGIIFFSFASIRNKLTGITNNEMARAISNSQLTREIAKVIADIDLLSWPFYGKSDYLKSEGSKLLSNIDNISENTTEPALKKALLFFRNHIEAFLNQCVVVNRVLYSRKSIERETYAQLTSLEDLMAELFVSLTVKGEETAFVEQLLTLVIGYRETLLEIGRLNGEHEREPYFIVQEEKISSVMADLDDFILRLQTITASTPDVSRNGKKILNNVKDYKKAIIKFYEEKEKLGSRMRDINHSKSLLMASMEEIEKDVANATQLVTLNIEETFYSSGAAVFMVLIFVVFFLGFATAYLIKSTLNDPMQAILAGLKSFGAGHFDNQIELGRGDEWNTIEKGLNGMAANLLKIHKTLQQSEEKYRSMMESMVDPVYICSSSYTVEYMNPAMVQRIGRDAAGEPCHNAMHGLGHKCQWCVFDKVLNGEVIEINIKSPLDDRNYRITNMPIHNNGSPVSKMVIYRDVTDHIIALEEKEKVESQLQQSQKMESIGTLAGGIAHDFNNILFPIMGHTEMLLLNSPENSPLQFSLDQIYAASMRARDLVKQILTFSRQASNELKLMNVQPIAKEALKLIRSSIPTTIAIQQNISPACPAIKADPTKIHQIVMNLTTNAFHAMEETGGEMKVTLKEVKVTESDIIDPEMSPGSFVCLTVSDTGTGIPEELKGKIFDPFFTTKKEGKGTGMGLSVVHGIVKSIGGTIHVQSEPGNGTEFNVYLPIAEIYSDTDEKQVKETIKGGTEKILFVDDEEIIIAIAKPMLEKMGYKVTSRTSSVEALEAFCSNSERFDIVVTDLAMPKLPGDRFAIELLKIRPDIPVILLTGYSEKMSAERAQFIGIKKILMKPVIMKELLQEIREVLDEV